MTNSTTNATILQPNPYAGGRPALPISMPITQWGTGGNQSNGSQGPGQNSITIDDDVSLSGPSTGLQGTPQTNEPYPGGNDQPITPGPDFTNTVPGMAPQTIRPGKVPPSGNATGWIQSENDWYYFDPDTGDLVKGWKEVEGLWYYLDPGDGHMLTGWRHIDGEWYYLETTDGNGQMVTGWKKDGEKYYYLFESGAMAHGGWLRIDGEWYCFKDSSGEMEEEKIIQFQENKYYVGKDGAMVTNASMPQVTCNGVTYEVDEYGVCTTNSVLPPIDANVEAWREYFKNDQSISETRKMIILEAFETIEQGCVYHQLRATDKKETPDKCLVKCDSEQNPLQTGDYKYSSMANYNIEDPLYLDCSFFVKHCYWKVNISMKATNTSGTDNLYDGDDFKDIDIKLMQTADIAVRKGHVALFVGWTRENKMVWAEMVDHKNDGRVSVYTQDSRFRYRRSKELKN